MSIWHAFFCVMAGAGILGAAYLSAVFLEFHYRHRRIARNRRWPRHGGQSDHFFAPLDRFPEE